MSSSKAGRRYSGSAAVAQLRAELDRLLQDALAASERAARSGWIPSTDVLDTGAALVVVVAVAGLSADEVGIEVEGNLLRIHGRRHLTFSSSRRIRFHCLERQEGAFLRELELQTPVDFGRATARLADGLLLIELPKVEDRRRKRQRIAVVEDPTPAETASPPSEKSTARPAEPPSTEEDRRR